MPPFLLFLSFSLLLIACHSTLSPEQPVSQQSLSITTEESDMARPLPPIPGLEDDETLTFPEESLDKQLEVRSPAPGGVSFSEPIHLDLRYRQPSTLQIELDGKDISDRLHRGPLKHQWVATFPTLTSGKHQLRVILPSQPPQTVPFDYQTSKPIAQIIALADATLKRYQPKQMKWDWGEGLLLYALARLDEHLGQSRYRPFITAYYQHYLQQGLPKIDWSDRCAPGLAALELYRQTGQSAYRDMAAQVIHYLKTMPPTSDGGLNHFGISFFSHFYPQSMWIDSLMMYNVLAARWGHEMGDSQMTEFGAQQPIAFARVLQNPQTHLWKHAWLVKWKRPISKVDTYWLRGNGWAMVSLPETLAMLPASHPNRSQLVTAFQQTAQALLPYQSEGGLWETVLNKPGQTYLESSGTALVAYGLLKGIHDGYLPTSYAKSANRAFLSLLDRLEQTEKGPSMPEISHNTMPYSFLGYSLVPEKNDLPFGLAALILAGIESDR